jgi:hypothetical protein
MALEINNELNDPIKVAMDLDTIGFTFEQQGHFSGRKYQEARSLFKNMVGRYLPIVENHIARVKGEEKASEQ